MVLCVLPGVNLTIILFGLHQVMHVLLAYGLVCYPSQQRVLSAINYLTWRCLNLLRFWKVLTPAGAIVAHKSRTPCSALHSVTFSIAYRALSSAGAAPVVGTAGTQNSPELTAAIPLVVGAAAGSASVIARCRQVLVAWFSSLSSAGIVSSGRKLFAQVSESYDRDKELRVLY